MPMMQVAAATAPTPTPALMTPGAAASTVRITSEPAGAEIEVNGAFVGSTPATFQIPSGTHRIAVRRGAAVWQRDVLIQPGSSITVNALLSQR
jgi:hypothetical protein